MAPDLDGFFCIGQTGEVILIHVVAVMLKETWHVGGGEAGVWTVQGWQEEE